MDWRTLRSSPSAAWAGPFICFMVTGALGLSCRDEIAGAPWYFKSPEQWVYPLQTLVGLAAVAFWWKHYSFHPLRPSGIALGILTGVVGILIWLVPSWLFLHGHVSENKWLGTVSRTDGFDPTIWADQPGMWWLAVVLRFVRMVVCVAFIEELLWRGFVWRTVSEEYGDFWKGSFAKPSWKPFLAVTVLIVLAHAPVDYAGALPWAILTSLLYLKTRSVGVLVICHAVANLLLGLYVMHSKQWGLW